VKLKTCILYNPVIASLKKPIYTGLGNRYTKMFITALLVSYQNKKTKREISTSINVKMNKW
jgi:hypothetical protein